jgi:hypothetical protein
MGRTSKNPVVAVMKRIRTMSRNQKVGFGLISAGLVAGGVTFALIGMPDVKAVDNAVEMVAGKPTLSDLRQDVKENPADAAAQLALGHALFESGKHGLALVAYDKAMRMDSKTASKRVVDNVMVTFGAKEMTAAAAVITKHKLVDAEEGLRKHTRSTEYEVRVTALDTLEKINRLQKDDILRVETANLGVSSCDQRRLAIRNLAKLGDKRAIDPIRDAAKKDLEATPWYSVSCLRAIPMEAEQEILARGTPKTPATPKSEEKSVAAK